VYTYMEGIDGRKQFKFADADGIYIMSIYHMHVHQMMLFICILCSLD